jgi:hypothetical protein
MRTSWLVVLSLCSLSMFPCIPSAKGTPPPPSLNARIAEVVPKAAEERWLEIPWRTNLMAARREAQAAGKPLFLWVMVGNPQGCT